MWLETQKISMNHVHDSCYSVSSAASPLSLLIPLSALRMETWKLTRRAQTCSSWLQRPVKTSSGRSCLFFVACHWVNCLTYHLLTGNNLISLTTSELVKGCCGAPEASWSCGVLHSSVLCQGYLLFSLAQSHCPWDPIHISPPVLLPLPHVVLTFTSALSMSQMFASHT